MRAKYLLLALAFGALSLLALSARAQDAPSPTAASTPRYSVGVQGHFGTMLLVIFPSRAASWNLGMGGLRRGDGLWDLEMHVGLTSLGNSFSFGEDVRKECATAYQIDVPFLWRKWRKADRTGWFWSIGAQLSLVLHSYSEFSNPTEVQGHEIVWTPSAYRRGRASKHRVGHYVLPLRLALPIRVGYRFAQKPIELGASLAINVSPYDVSMNPAIFLFPAISAAYWF